MLFARLGAKRSKDRTSPIRRFVWDHIFHEIIDSISGDVRIILWLIRISNSMILTGSRCSERIRAHNRWLKPEHILKWKQSTTTNSESFPILGSGFVSILGSGFVSILGSGFDLRRIREEIDSSKSLFKISQIIKLIKSSNQVFNPVRSSSCLCI